MSHKYNILIQKSGKLQPLFLIIMAHTIDRKHNVIVRLLKEIILLLKEIANFHRFFRKTPKTDKVIVFYAEHEGYYPFFEGLIEELIGKLTLILTDHPNIAG